MQKDNWIDNDTVPYNIPSPLGSININKSRKTDKMARKILYKNTVYQKPNKKIVYYNPSIVKKDAETYTEPSTRSPIKKLWDTFDNPIINKADPESPNPQDNDFIRTLSRHSLIEEEQYTEPPLSAESASEPRSATKTPISTTKSQKQNLKDVKREVVMMKHCEEKDRNHVNNSIDLSYHKSCESSDYSSDTYELDLHSTRNDLTPQKQTSMIVRHIVLWYRHDIVSRILKLSFRVVKGTL